MICSSYHIFEETQADRILEGVIDDLLHPDCAADFCGCCGNGVRRCSCTVKELREFDLRIKGITWWKDGCLLWACKKDEEGVKFLLFDSKTDNVC